MMATMQIQIQINILFYFFLKNCYAKKQCGWQFWNAVEREPVETRVLNPTASEASQLRNNVVTEKRSNFFFLQIFEIYMEDWKSAQ